MDWNNMNFASRVRFYRNLKQITLAELADELGITTTHISQIERGLAEPSISLFIKLLNALNARAEYLLQDKLAVASVWVFEEKYKNARSELSSKKFKLVDTTMKNLHDLWD